MVIAILDYISDIGSVLSVAEKLLKVNAIFTSELIRFRVLQVLKV